MDLSILDGWLWPKDDFKTIILYSKTAGINSLEWVPYNEVGKRSTLCHGLRIRIRYSNCLPAFELQLIKNEKVE